MASPIPSMSALRILRQSIQPQIRPANQVRHATLLRRPKRPYTFTQLMTLSDGSSFTVRTTNPTPVYKSAKDIRNSPLWNPTSQKLLNVEEDEAGKLAGFRARFGRGWDADTEAEKGKQGEDHLLDLISRQAKSSGKTTDATKTSPAKASASTPAKPAAKK
ncbi:50S ribosomal L36 [Pyrenophora seminiperda CCB06]|uniref:50S ribosomal L36 n=1 Tax=Pyrenophora seminiperda CCB06 TaxID=1302712 RepID=A0A3M7M7R9_9PLEO|nr:50S ribosomal L36 [Pyrenophora seminiperda CCB06]